MQSDVELEDGQRIWLRSFSGEVVEATKGSETSVYSKTDTVASRVGSIPYTAVYSEIDRAHSMWLRAPDGMEQEVVLDHHDFSTRVGHEVTVLWGAAEGQTRGSYLGAVNHVTGGVWRKDLSTMKPLVNTDFAVQHNLDRGRRPSGLTLGVVASALGVGFVTRYLFRGDWVATLVTVLIFAAVFWFGRRTASNVSHYTRMSESLRMLDAQVEKSMQVLADRKTVAATMSPGK